MVRSRSVQKRTEPTAVAEMLLEAVFDSAVAALRKVARLIRLAILFPMLSVPILATLLAGSHGWPYAVAVGVVSVAGLVAWRVRQPTSFRRLVSERIRRRRRRWLVYCQPWPEICALHGLTRELNDQVCVPKLSRVTIGTASDVLVVGMVLGQTLAEWQAAGEALAHGFGALTVRVRQQSPGVILVEVQHTDSLANPIQCGQPAENVDLARVDVGRTESGGPWTLPVLGRHVLVAGATGAGKGSVAWSLISGLAPAIRDGIVELWVVDPKGGMEFGAGQQLYSRFAYDTGEMTLQLLRDAADLLTRRANRLRGLTRQHVPTTDEPLIVILIDEIASLTAYVPDRKVRAEAEQLIGLILSQGRAVGVTVLACLQDPAKEVLSFRQLFPIRVALRLSEPNQVAMVLGQSARDRGARCDLIPEWQPGVGYVSDDGSNELTRVRAYQVTDTAINELVRDYSPRQFLTAEE